jgi:hypothetical protein
MPIGILTQSTVTYKCPYRRHSTSEIWWNESTTHSDWRAASLSSETNQLKLSLNRTINSKKRQYCGDFLRLALLKWHLTFFQLKESFYGIFNLYQNQASQQIQLRQF